MPTGVRYCAIQMKNAFGCMLRSIVSLLVMLALLGLLAAGASLLAEQEQEAAQVTIGVSLPESDTMFRSLVSFANHISGLRQFCRLEIFSLDEALEKLNEGSLALVMEVPEGFYEQAEQMEDVSFTVYMAKDPGPGEKKILALFGSVEEIMGTVECGILSLYPQVDSVTFPVTRAQMEDGLTELYVMQFLGREAWFDTEYLSPYGAFSAAQYYLASAILLLVLAGGISYLELFSGQQKTLGEVLFQRPVYRTGGEMIRMLSAAVMLWLVMAVLLSAGTGGLSAFGFRMDIPDVGALFILFLIAFSGAALIRLIAAGTGDGESAAFLLVMITVLMGSISGCLIPTVYLPGPLAAAGRLLPAGIWHRMILESCSGELQGTTLLLWAGETLLLLGAGEAVSRRRRN